MFADKSMETSLNSWQPKQSQKAFGAALYTSPGTIDLQEPLGNIAHYPTWACGCQMVTDWTLAMWNFISSQGVIFRPVSLLIAMTTPGAVDQHCAAAG